MLVCLGIKREDRPGGFPANAPDRIARATRKMTGTEAGRSIDTVAVSTTPRMIDKELTQLGWNLATIRTPDPFDRRTYASTHALPPFVELVIIDEADRLKTTAWSSSATTTTAAASA
jgi:hypothetical protein